MTDKKDIFENYKEDKLTRPIDDAWGNWKSWKDAKVGDKVQGFIKDAGYKGPQEGEERGQRIVCLETVDGELVNVGIKDLSFVLKSTDALRIGDPLTIEFIEQQQPAVKGQNGAKIYGYFGKNLPETEGKPTVKELDEKDRLAGGLEAPAEETEPEEEQVTVKDENGEEKPF